jgi:hypothetical protein
VRVGLVLRRSVRNPGASSPDQAAIWSGSSWGAGQGDDSTGDTVNSVSCPSASFCALVDGNGNATTYDGSAWSAPTQIDSSILTSVSCASASFCVAVDENGGALTFNGSSWSGPVTISSGDRLTSVSCPSASFCAAVDDGGNALIYPASAQRYTLSVTLAGSGRGSVSGSGFFCQTPCIHSQTYPGGSTVRLTATPSAGSVFSGWSGTCSGTGTCQLTMNSDQAVRATFARVSLPQLRLTVKPVRVFAGQRVLFRFIVTIRLASGHLAGVRGARIVLAGRRAVFTDGGGFARLRTLFRRPGRFGVTASKRGYRSATVRVVVAHRLRRVRH